MSRRRSRRAFIASVPTVVLSGCLSGFFGDEDEETTERCDIETGSWQGQAKPISRTVESEWGVRDGDCAGKASEFVLQALNDRMEIELEDKNWLGLLHSDDEVLVVVPAPWNADQPVCPDPEFDPETARNLLPSSVTVRLERPDSEGLIHECTLDVRLDINS